MSINDNKQLTELYSQEVVLLEIRVSNVQNYDNFITTADYDINSIQPRPKQDNGKKDLSGSAILPKMKF